MREWKCRRVLSTTRAKRAPLRPTRLSLRYTTHLNDLEASPRYDLPRPYAPRARTELELDDAIICVLQVGTGHHLGGLSVPVETAPWIHWK